MTTREPVRLTVNPVACDAVGFCAHVASGLVDLDRWGYPVLPTEAVPAAQLGAARRAVHSCPRRALGLVTAEPSR